MRRIAFPVAAVTLGWLAFAHAQSAETPPVEAQTGTTPETPAKAGPKPKAGSGPAKEERIPQEALQPIDIDADVFEADGREKRGVFRGNVIARQGDVTIRAERIEARYSRQANAITTAAADGGVTVTSGGKVGKASRAEFDNARRTVILTGDPRLWEEGTVLEGRRIVFHVDDGRVECFECSVDVDPARIQEMTDESSKLPAR